MSNKIKSFFKTYFTQKGKIKKLELEIEKLKIKKNNYKKKCKNLKRQFVNQSNRLDVIKDENKTIIFTGEKTEIEILKICKIFNSALGKIEGNNIIIGKLEKKTGQITFDIPE